MTLTCWLMPIIPGTQEAKIGRIAVWGQSRQKFIIKTKNKKVQPIKVGCGVTCLSSQLCGKRNRRFTDQAYTRDCMWKITKQTKAGGISDRAPDQQVWGAEFKPQNCKIIIILLYNDMLYNYILIVYRLIKKHSGWQKFRRHVFMCTRTSTKIWWIGESSAVFLLWRTKPARKQISFIYPLWVLWVISLFRENFILLGF
jgi:hypothetical protein